MIPTKKLRTTNRAFNLLTLIAFVLFNIIAPDISAIPDIDINNSGASIVNDTIMCPGDTTVDSEPGECGAYVSYEDPIVIEPFDLILIDGLPSGSLFPITTTTQTFGATDASGNIVSTCSFDVTVLPLATDSDCDGVTDDCDVCDGGDDTIDANNDGIPDCVEFPGFEFVDESWECSNNPNNTKYYICHQNNGNNGPNTICVSENAVLAHLAHGDFLGPCIDCSSQSRNAGESATVLDAQIGVYPNPASDQLVVSMEGFAEGDVYVRLSNTAGVNVWDEMVEFHGASREHTIQLQKSGITNGFYILQVAQGDMVISEKIVVLN